MVQVIKEKDIIYNKKYCTILKGAGLYSFDSIMDYKGGKCIKKTENVSVYYIKLKNGIFYLKRYNISIKGAFEPLFKLKQVERNGLKEWENIFKINNIGINTATPVAAGSRRSGLLQSKSFILTEDLHNAKKLDEFFRKKFLPPNDKEMIKLKRTIIFKLANIVKKLHENRLSHQDLYLGHFYIQFNRERDFNLYLIDLQRVRESSSVVNQRRHRIKDLSQLFFASHYEVFVSNPDRLRFYNAYIDCRHLTGKDLELFGLVYRRAKKVAEHTRKHAFPLPDISWQPQI